MLGVFFAVLAATAWLFVKVPKGFIPEQDTDQMYVNMEAAQGTSYYQMVRLERTVAEILRRDPNVDTFHAERRRIATTPAPTAAA